MLEPSIWRRLLDWGTWLAGFALAWTVGLVVPGAPGGFGVFETVLLLRLAQELDEPALLAVALSYRLVTTLADLLGAGLVNLDERWRLPSPQGKRQLRAPEGGTFPKTLLNRTYC